MFVFSSAKIGQVVKSKAFRILTHCHQHAQQDIFAIKDIFLQKIPPSVFLNFEHQSEELMYYFSTQSILYKPHNFGCRLQGFQINPTKTQIDLGFLREVQLQNQQLSLKLFFSLMVILCIYLKLDQTLFILNPILFSIQHHQ